MGKKTSGMDQFRNKRKIVTDELLTEDIKVEIKYDPDEVVHIQIVEIEQSPDQSRVIETDSADIRELANNIQEVGLIQPIIVRKDKENDKWILVCGERRLAAHKLLNRRTIAAIVRNELNEDKIKSWALTLSENVMRKQLNPAEAFDAIEIGKKTHGLKGAEIAEMLGVSESRVAQIHGISKLPTDLLESLEKENKLTARHVSAFKTLLGGTAIESLDPDEVDNEYVKKVKENLETLKNEVITDDLSGKEAIKRAKEIKDPRTERSFLSTLSIRLRHTIIHKKPKRMSESKRALSIKQAKAMISLLEGYISEEETKLKTQGA